MAFIFLVWKNVLSNYTKIIFLELLTFMTLLGTYFITHFKGFFQNIIPLLALIVGMLLHISTTALFESNRGHRFNLQKLTSILSGQGIVYLF